MLKGRNVITWPDYLPCSDGYWRFRYSGVYGSLTGGRKKGYGDVCIIQHVEEFVEPKVSGMCTYLFFALAMRTIESSQIYRHLAIHIVLIDDDHGIQMGSYRPPSWSNCCAQKVMLTYISNSTISRPHGVRYDQVHDSTHTLLYVHSASARSLCSECTAGCGRGTHHGRHHTCLGSLLGGNPSRSNWSHWNK